jgi:hypothetical protein
MPPVRRLWNLVRALVLVMSDGGLRRHYQEHLAPRGVHLQAIETGAIGPGTPDTNGCYRGTEFWIENKVTSGWSPKEVRPAQVGWILRRRRAGGRAFFAVRRQHEGGPRRGAAVDELYLIGGDAAREFKDGGLRGLPPGALLGSWTGGPSRWGWDEFLRLITR